MRFFKHGDVLAITIPESVRKKFDVKDGDDYDFVEIERGLFALITKEKGIDVIKQKIMEKTKGTPLAIQPPKLAQVTKSFIPASQLPKTNYRQALLAKGFLVLENEDQAKGASIEMEKDIKTGEVRGVRSFDKKFYLSTKQFLETNGPNLEKILAKQDANASDVAKEAKLTTEATLTVLYLLKEEGELIEKKRGFFSLVK